MSRWRRGLPAPAALAQCLLAKCSPLHRPLLPPHLSQRVPKPLHPAARESHPVTPRTKQTSSPRARPPTCDMRVLVRRRFGQKTRARSAGDRRASSLERVQVDFYNVRLLFPCHMSGSSSLSSSISSPCRAAAGGTKSAEIKGPVAARGFTDRRPGEEKKTVDGGCTPGLMRIVTK